LRWWRQAWPGLLATLDGVGLCRFAYTPLIPFMIASGLLTATGAAYLGAANLLGYLAGAAVAAPLATRIGLGLAIRASFCLSVLSLAACVPDLGFSTYAIARFVAGVTGAFLMVLAPSYLLAEIEPGERGRAGGVIYTGVGIGIAVSSLIVPLLADHRPSWAWAALALGALATTAATWSRWGKRRSVRRLPPGAGHLGLPVLLVMIAFGMDGIGFVPHMLFWVDYISRSLGLGVAAGALQWLLFGLGAAIGPSMGGMVGDAIGIGRALVLAFALKAAAVLVPTLWTGFPALAFSSVIVGALTPGIAAICAARMTELVPPAGQMRAWGYATLCFGLFQAAGGYGMAFAFDMLRSYVPLYVAGAGFEAIGAAAALAALLWQQPPIGATAVLSRENGVDGITQYKDDK
jgi:predicted MFS family arabinose efflux permease